MTTGLFDEHGLAFLRQLKQHLVWEDSSEWRSEVLLSSLEHLAPDFEAWATAFANGDYLQGDDR